MTFLRRYKIKSDTRAYPRYLSYRNKLGSVFSRVQRILETNDLIGLFGDRQIAWNAIKTDVENCIGSTSSINLYVLASASSDLDKIRDELFRDKTVFEDNKRRKLPKEDVDEENLDWESFIEHVGHTPDQEIIIYSTWETAEPNVSGDLINRLPDDQKGHIIIYYMKTGTSQLFGDPTTTTEKKVLCQNVEYLLERNAIGILEDTLSIFGRLVPRKDDSHMAVGDIVEGVISCLNNSLENLTFLKELLPDNLEEDMSPQGIEEFHQTVQSKLARKTRFKFQELICKKLGIKDLFVHEFMSEKGFDYEEKFQKGITVGVLPIFPIEHGLKELKDAFKHLRICCRDLCLELVSKAEAFVRDKYKALDTLKKIQFEIFGILRTNSRCRTVKLPDGIQVSDRLLDDLLRLDYVEACSSLFGILTITVSEDLSKEQRKEVTELFRTHKFFQEYEVKVKLTLKEHGPIIEHGNGIVSEFAPGGRDKFMKDKNVNQEIIDQNYIKGTLGCFVEPVTGDGLYAVTCYHCIQEEYFQKDIKVQMGQIRNFDDLGVRSYWLYDKYTLDIGLIKVHEHMIPRCDKTMVKEDELMKSVDWKFRDNLSDNLKLIGQQVYKKGLIDFTRGIIAGYDFKTKSMTELKDMGFSEHSNMFITTRPGESEDISRIPKFSEDGDSGSVVCMEIIPEEPDKPSYVEVISLLCGSITLKDTDNPHLPSETLSYSCKMRGLLDELTKQKGCPELKEAIEEEKQ